MDGELVRLGAELFVFRSGHADAPNTAGIAALTDQIEELLLQLERLGEIRDRNVCTAELLQNAASRGVRERGERGIQAGPRILNHVVQYLAHALAACKEAERMPRWRQRSVEAQLRGHTRA